MLIKASVKYFLVILGGVFVSFAMTGMVGTLIGYSFKEAILYVALGVMPKKYEIGAFQWFRVVMINLTPALLVGIGGAFMLILATMLLNIFS